ncbi:hypothetical protein [Haliscomenobacter sp.]|uniref:hypothetical protein n=1 Tax=Haliscomenobacter sp. TaxID=2717303 RepID=UPI003594517D
MKTKDFYALLIRLFLGYVFASAGLCKLTDGQFGQLIGPPLLIKQLAEYDLELFGQFIALSQVLVGMMVMSQRYSVLGLIMLVPVNVSILMVTISQNWKGTPYVDAVLVALNILALLYEWKSLKFLLLPDTMEIKAPAKVNELFPNVWWGTLGIGFGALGGLLGVWSFPATLAFGSLAFVSMYVNVFTFQSYYLLEKIILALSGLAILSVTFVGFLQKAMWVLLGGSILLVFVLLLVRTFLYKK